MVPLTVVGMGSGVSSTELTKGVMFGSPFTFVKYVFWAAAVKIQTANCDLGDVQNLIAWQVDRSKSVHEKNTGNQNNVIKMHLYKCSEIVVFVYCHFGNILQ